jgi:hypothetical protein
MTQGFDGAWWFTQSSSNTGTQNIGRFVAPSTLTDYPVPGVNTVYGITTGTDGAVWFSDHDEHKLGRITPDGTMTDYTVGASLQPGEIASGPDGNLWFVDASANKIGKFTLPSSATFSGDLAYVKYRPTGGSVMEAVNLTGNASPQTLTSTSGSVRYVTPYFNPDRTRLYYSYQQTATPALQVMPSSTIEGTAALRCEMPAVSPDSTRLACFDLVGGKRAIKVVSLSNGQGPTINLSGVGPNDLLQPRVDWLSDSSIVFSVTPSGCGSSYIARVNVDGSGFTPLTSTTCGAPFVFAPRVSADRTMIAYQRDNGIWTMNADGTNQAPLFAATPTLVLGYPAWSRDGKYISATGNDPNTPNQNSSIMVINAQTGAVVKTILQQGDYAFGESDWIGTYTQPDTAAPTVTGTPDRAPNAAGWYGADVTINWSAVDPEPSSGVPTTPPTVVANQNGTHVYTSAPSCDPAGNCATGSLSLNIDKTDPTITYSLSQTPNGNNWNNGDVTVTFACDDAVSGVALCTQPVTLAEGANQSVTGTATDLAGNTKSIQVTLNIDKTAPSISFTKSPDANSAGWNNSDVTVDFSCVDALSTIAGCTDPVTVGEGANQTVTGTALDKADNSSSVSTIVNVDKTAPTISYSLSQAPNAAGWNTSDVTVTFACNDALSGVASCSGPVTVGEGANQTVTGTAVDAAGNTSTVSVTLNVDSTLPTINYALSHQPSLFGWDNTDVTVTFTCSDALSGIASCPDPITIGEGANQNVTGTAVDAAGNTAATSITLNVDKTGPMITYGLSSAPNAAGWFKTDVTVNFQCLDFLSGVYLCSDPVTLSNDGVGQAITGSVTDQALNIETVTAAPINIDKTAPTLSNVAFTTNPLAVNTTTTLSAQVGDATSGVSRVEYFVDNLDPGAGNGTAMTVSSGVATTTVGAYTTPGMHTYSVRVQDVAGNWGPTITINLDVYNPADSHAASHGFIDPGGATSDLNPGDYLPTVSGNNIKATIDLTLDYATPTATVPTGTSTFTWGPAANGNCKKTPNNCFVVEATSVAWLVVPGNGTADFQGLANVSLNGSPVGLGSNYPFRVHLVDNDGTTFTEHYRLDVYPIGSDPDYAQPIYQASGDLTGGHVTLLPLPV